VQRVRESALLPYLIALAAVGIATVCQLAFEPWLGQPFAFAILLLAVLFAAWYGGRGPALFAAFAGSAFAALVLLAPRGSIAIAEVHNRVGLLLYLFASTGVAFLAGSMHSALKRAQQLGALLADQRDHELAEWTRAERAVRASEERLRLALEAGRMGTWEWDIPGNTVRWSPTLEAIHGLAAGSFPGSFEAYQSDIHPEDRARVLRSIAETLEQNREHRIQYRIVWKDGSVHWIEAWGRLFRDEEGRPLRMMGVCMDADERKHTEHTMRFLADASAALAVIEDHQRTLDRVVHLAVPLFADWCAVDLLDDEGGLRRIAVAQVDPGKAAHGQDVFRGGSHGAWQVIRSARSELVAEITEETLATWLDESECAASVRELGLKSYIGVPLLARGAVLGVLSFATAGSRRHFDGRDLTVAEDLAQRVGMAIENARLYHALRESDRRKDEFLALLGHELRNPLAPIRNALNVLCLPTADEDTGARAKQVMARQLEHLVRLVDDLLDVSRIMRGKVALRREPVDVQAVIGRAVETVRPTIDANGHALSIEAPAQALWVNGDAVRLAQVVSNLLDNAAKYTRSGGRIVVSAAHEGEEVVIRVRDSGLGIEPAHLSRIFDMFFQAERRTDSASGGLGIGLSLVRGLVELHGGSVEAHSAGSGLGSEFVVRLPLVSRPQLLMTPASPLPQLPATRRRVLVVDDNADAADSLAMLLRLEGHEVSVAYDGATALALAEKSPPALAFVDLGMPGMSGYELAARWRSHPQLKEVPLIALTGWGQPADRERTSSAGFDHHLVKPVELDALRRLLADPAALRAVELKDDTPAPT
jgi:PAS domain S-box-containing protein